MPKREATEADILRKYQRMQEFQTDTAFADALTVSRQKMSSWLKGFHYPEFGWLVQIARLFAGSWQSDLAVELLRRRGNEEDIPCICSEEIGDNGPCPKPKHGGQQLAISDEQKVETIVAGQNKETVTS